VRHFLSGGLPYNTPVGNLPVAGPAGTPPIQIKSDHNVLAGDAADVYDALAALQHNGHPLAPAHGYVDMANVEYATPALDELAPGSNARFQAQAQAIDANVQAVLGAFPQFIWSQPANWGGRRTGLPYAALGAWLGPHLSHDPALLAAIHQFMGDVRFRLYVQATAGVLPSGLGLLYGLHAAAPGPYAAEADARQAILAATVALSNDAGFQAWLTHWQNTAHPGFFPGFFPGERDAILGVAALGLAAAIGGAMNQTSLGSGSAKNAVDLLPKRDIGHVRSALPARLRANPPPAGFANYIAAWFHANVPQIGLAHWTGAPYHAALIAAGERIPTYGAAGAAPQQANTAAVLTRMFWGGGGMALAIAPGVALPQNDPASAQIGAHAGGQQGFPLEYRWIDTYPTAPGQLWPVFQQVLNEARVANLVQMPQNVIANVIGAL
jgi:hypothetical protein